MTEGRQSSKDFSVEKRVTALAGQLDRLRQGHEDLDGRHTETRKAADAGLRVAREALALVQRVGQSTAPAGDAEEEEEEAPKPLLCVLSILPGQEEELAEELESLASWLAQVYLRYEDARLPECWAWHTAAVEELLTLQTMWEIGYRLRPNPQAVADWHDRYRPGVVRRLGELEVTMVHREGAAATKFVDCLPGHHSDPANYRPRKLYGADALGAITDYLIGGGAPGSAPPQPTKEAVDLAMVRRQSGS